MQIMNNCWILLFTTIAIVTGLPPDLASPGENLDTPRTARQTSTHSVSVSIKRTQPVPRRAIRILDPNYVSEVFGRPGSGNGVSRNKNVIPSPYLVPQTNSASTNTLNKFSDANNNVYSSLFVQNGSNDHKNNGNLGYASQLYDTQQFLQPGQSNANQQNQFLATTDDSSAENFISKQPVPESLNVNNNKNGNLFTNNGSSQSSESNIVGQYKSTNFEKQNDTKQSPNDNLVYDFGESQNSQIIGKDFKRFGSNFAALEDIHTDSDDLNAFGLELLSNDGINSKRSVGVSLPQTEVIKLVPQDIIVLGKDNNRIIIANENLAQDIKQGNNGLSTGIPLPLDNVNSHDRSSQQFTIQGDFESFGNQGGSSFGSSQLSSNNGNTHNENQQQAFTVKRDEDSFEIFGNNAATFGVPIPTPVRNNPNPTHQDNKVESIPNKYDTGSIGIPLPYSVNENNGIKHDNSQGGQNNNINQEVSHGIPLPSTIQGESQNASQEGTLGIPLPSIVNGNNSQGESKNIDQGGTSGIPLPSTVNNNNNDLKYSDNIQGASQNSNQGGSFGIPLPSTVNNNNDLKYSDNIPGASQNSNQGGSFGIPLPSSITDNAGQAQDNIQVDSVINAINSASNGNQDHIESIIGGMTIGELLNGINGKNGIMVLPMSSASGLNLQSGGSNGNKISIREGSDEEVLVESSPSTSPTITTTEATVTRVSRRRTTTRPPDHLRRSLSDLLYAKGQWFGTLIGGIIDYGQIVQDAYKKTLGNDSRQPYA